MKSAFYKGQSRGQILRKFGLHYIGSELGIMKKILTARESTYIELIFSKKSGNQSLSKSQCPRLKAFAKTNNSKNAQNRQRSTKRKEIDQNQDLESRFQGT